MKTPNIKRLLLLTLVMMTISLAGMAQNADMANATVEEKAEVATEKQKEALGLDSGQEEEMYALNLKYIRELEDIKAGGRSLSTMRKLKDMSGRRDEEVKGVLSKDQYKEYEKFRDEQRAQMKKESQARQANG